MTDFRALCEELVNELSGYKMANPMHDWYLLNRARLALAEPEPPFDGEVAELVNHLLKVADEDESDGCTYDSAFTRRAAELLERQTPQPVPEVPTNEKLLALWRGDRDYRVVPFARAVLDRWGHHPAPGG